jgi:hypothetical protein
MSQPMRGSTIHAWRLELDLQLGTGRSGSAVYIQNES